MNKWINRSMDGAVCSALLCPALPCSQKHRISIPRKNKKKKNPVSIKHKTPDQEGFRPCFVNTNPVNTAAAAAAAAAAAQKWEHGMAWHD